MTCSRSVFVIGLGVIVPLMVVAASVQVATSGAAFLDTTANPANSWAAASSWTNVQNGTLTMTGSGTTTVSISSVDPAKAFLLFQTRHAGNRPPNSMLRGRIASGTSLEFVRATDEGPLGYSYRRQLTISAGANTPSGGYNGYTVRLTGIDTQALISAGKLRSDGNDLRIFYWNGSSYVEVDREVRNLDSTDTHVIFQSQADIAASGSNTGHYLFYGNPSAGAPNALGTTNVYLWYDDASQDRLSSYITGRGDPWHCCATYVDSIAWNAAGYYTFDTGNDVTNSMRRAVNERDVLVEAEFYHIGAYPNDMTSGVLSRYQGSGSGDTEASDHYYGSNRADSPFESSSGYSHDVSIMKDARGTIAIGPAEGGTAPAIAGNQWRKQALAVWLINDTNGKYWDDDVASDLTRGWPADGVADYLKSGTDAGTGDKEGSGDAGVIVAQDAGRVRHVLIRRYIEPEPTVGAGVETTIPPIDIQWYVVEIPTGVNVQRGEVTQSATTIDVPITAVAGLDQAFVTWSKTPAPGDGDWSQDDPLVGELTTASNLQFRTNSASSNHVIWWQVVEFTNAADINVQTGSTSLTGSALTTNATLGTTVDPNKTFVLVGYRTAGGGADVGERMLRARLIDSTTITLDRNTFGDDMTEIVWQAVELTNGSSVQRGNGSFATSEAQTTASITSVNTDRSVAFASVQPVGGQNMGRSPYAGDDIIGVCSVTMSLASTLVTMDRNNTADTCDVGWFVVEFAP